ncbi:MAG: ELWxxDGT repeat protein [Planctomycetota bacterium]
MLARRESCHAHRLVLATLVVVVAVAVSAAAAQSPSLLRDIHQAPTRVGSNPQEFAPFLGGVLIVAERRDVGRELFFSPPGLATHMLVADIRPGPLGSLLRRLTIAGQHAFFAATDGVHGFELWRTDGTAAGTALVKDLVPGSSSGLSANPTLFHPAH